MVVLESQSLNAGNVPFREAEGQAGNGLMRKCLSKLALERSAGAEKLSEKENESSVIIMKEGTEALWRAEVRAETYRDCRRPRVLNT